jgi:hypothetical protein
MWNLNTMSHHSNQSQKTTDTGPLFFIFALLRAGRGCHGPSASRVASVHALCMRVRKDVKEREICVEVRAKRESARACMKGRERRISVQQGVLIVYF